MKVQSVELRCFKRFEHKPISLAEEETGLARDLVILVGENGSGKSTILQAIAATLGTATRRLMSPAELRWPGFNLELVGGAWASPPEVERCVELSRDEREATAEYFRLVAAQRAMDSLVCLRSSMAIWQERILPDAASDFGTVTSMLSPPLPSRLSARHSHRARRSIYLIAHVLRAICSIRLLFAATGRDPVRAHPGLMVTRRRSRISANGSGRRLGRSRTIRRSAGRSPS